MKILNFFVVLTCLIFLNSLSQAETLSYGSGRCSLYTSDSRFPPTLNRSAFQFSEIAKEIEDGPYYRSQASSSKPEVKGYKSCNEKQRGVASIYGIPGRDRFAGQKTASGERMSPQKMRAAILNSASEKHALGSWVKVTKGNRSVIVCLNDIGGGKRGRVIDLTSAAASEINNGDLSTVQVECLIEPTKGRLPCDDKVGQLLEGL